MNKNKLREILASENLREAGSYQPEGNWVMYDLAVQDAHKGKPDRQLYRTDKDYKVQYDEEVARIKKLRSKRASAVSKGFTDQLDRLHSDAQREVYDLKKDIYNRMLKKAEADLKSYLSRSLSKFLKANKGAEGMSLESLEVSLLKKSYPGLGPFVEFVMDASILAPAVSKLDMREVPSLSAEEYLYRIIPEPLHTRSSDWYGKATFSSAGDGLVRIDIQDYTFYNFPAL